MKQPVVIVGAGMAGLTCAWYLHQWGIPYELIDASECPGGRVQTDVVDGFLLDHGFQVFLSAYPEPRYVLNLAELEVAPFTNGAKIWLGETVGFKTVVDPWRAPWALVETLTNGVGTLQDKFLLFQLRSQVLKAPIYEAFVHDAVSTQEYLEQFGFSAGFIDQFFRPFFGGIFLDSALHTSSALFQFLFRQFATGDAVLPAAGMGAIPRQIAAHLRSGSLRLGESVTSVSAHQVALDGGHTLPAHGVVVATQAPVAQSLVGVEPPSSWYGTTCLYFKAHHSPVFGGILVLNGLGAQDGPINTLCVLSEVQPTYSPDSDALVCVSVNGYHADTQTLVNQVLQQATSWYGSQVGDWQLLAAYPIEHALPSFGAASRLKSPDEVTVEPGVFVCGDYCQYPSLNGAMASGRQAARLAANYISQKA